MDRHLIVHEQRVGSPLSDAYDAVRLYWMHVQRCTNALGKVDKVGKADGYVRGLRAALLLLLPPLAPEPGPQKG